MPPKCTTCGQYYWSDHPCKCGRTSGNQHKPVPVVAGECRSSDNVFQHVDDEGFPIDETLFRIARVLCKWRNGKRSDVLFEKMSRAEQNAYLEQAQDAIAAITNTAEG